MNCHVIAFFFIGGVLGLKIWGMTGLEEKEDQ